MKDQDDFFDDLINNESEDENSDLDSIFGEESEAEDAKVRTVVLSKNDMIALLALRISPAGSQIVRVDPRQPIPAAQNYEDSEAASLWFKRSLRTSRKNGWDVVYDGEPIFG